MPKEKVKIQEEEEKKVAKVAKPKKASQTEFEEKVLELAKKGLTSEKIGEELRQQKIHPKDYNKKISKILKEKEAYINPVLKNVQTNLENI